jgi:ElaB/YqjD/DUF883 family membrane-anchored ribosome-binding protein
MANPNETLPEGTDSIITGAGVGSEDSFGGDVNETSISGNRSGSESGTSRGADFATQSTLTDDSAAGASGGADLTAGAAGASTSGGTGSFSRDRAVQSLRSGTEKLSGQAAEKARGLVGQGLERGSEALANVSRLIGDTATGLDERLGSQYGDYARQAATTIEETANRLASKDADELIDDTRDFVRKSPGVALAGAAVLGFALVRLVKTGLDLPSDSNGSRSRNDSGNGNDNGTQI